MWKFLVYFFLFVLAVVLVVFFVANRHEVLISFDPISLDNPAFAIGPMPMWSALAGTLFIGFGLGAVGMWSTDGSLRQKAKERKLEIKRLKAELKMAAGERPDEGSPKKGITLPALRG